MSEDNEVVPQRLFKLFLLLLSGASILIFIIGILLYRFELEEFKFAVTKQQQHIMDLLQSASRSLFQEIHTDLFVLTEQNELADWIAADDAHRSVYAHNIAKEYVALARHKQRYDQIRFIDASGQEQARVNYYHGQPAIVAADELQNKGQRYYFKDAIDLPSGTVFMSPFDLNIEHGILEQPLKPMIRFAIPVFDQTHKSQGIIILNYLGDHFLNQVRATAAGTDSQVQLVNAQGDWLLAPPGQQAWTFMEQLPPAANFASVYPQIWLQMRQQRTGQLWSDQGFFTFQALYPLLPNAISSDGSGLAQQPSTHKVTEQDYFWMIVLHVPKAVITDYQQGIIVRFLLFGVCSLALLAIVIWITVLMLLKRQQPIVDDLTGLPPTVFFFDRLEQLHTNAMRYQRRYAVLYIKLLGVDAIKSRFGDDAIQQLQQRIARLLTNSLRRADTVSRLDNNEFAVLLSDIKDSVAAMAMSEKILAALTAPIRLRSGDVEIGVDIGVATFPEQAQDEKSLFDIARQGVYSSVD
jgi:diguanylate cyclase (GGDEF)-like protein